MLVSKEQRHEVVAILKPAAVELLRIRNASSPNESGAMLWSSLTGTTATREPGRPSRTRSKSATASSTPSSDERHAHSSPPGRSLCGSSSVVSTMRSSPLTRRRRTSVVERRARHRGRSIRSHLRPRLIGSQGAPKSRSDSISAASGEAAGTAMVEPEEGPPSIEQPRPFRHMEQLAPRDRVGSAVRARTHREPGPGAVGHEIPGLDGEVANRWNRVDPCRRRRRWPR